MKLDLNFHALTKLKDWWVQVQNNFKIIETECTTTRTLAENACTPEQAEEYLAELVGSNAEYMEAITAFKELYESSGDSTAALETLFGERVTLTEYNAHKNNTEIHHTHANKAVLDAITADKVSVWDSKSDVVFGTYTGDGAESRTINLGFTPVAVEIYSTDGSQTYHDNATATHNGGFAMQGNPCGKEWGETLIFFEIVENGFKVYSGSKSSGGNTQKWTLNDVGEHYFKAYKNGTIREV